MDSRLLKEIRFLKVYAFATSSLLIVLVLTGFHSGNETERFKEITVERINIVEADGKTRMVISNKELFPPAIFGGKTFTRQGTPFPGMVFYNEKGDECGGFGFRSQEEQGQYFAGAAFMFDQYNQDQVIGIMYEDANGQRSAGLTVWDRPTTSILPIAEKLESIRKMKDGPEKTEALKQLQQLAEKGEMGVNRLFVGRQYDGSAEITLRDIKGKARIRMLVDSANVPSLDFLNEKGEVIYRLPAK